MATLNSTKSLRLPGTPLALALMIVLSVMIGLHALGFQLRLSGDPMFHQRFDEMPIFSSMHVIGGAIVLLVGGFQFWGGLRNRFPAIHRNLGRLYLTFVLIGGIGGLMLAPYSAGGLVAHTGFGLLAIVWLFSGWQAWAAIRARDIASHRAWMMRNFSLAFGAVSLRVYLGVLTAGFNLPFSEVYPMVAWASWVPNLILVEWYLAMNPRLWQRANAHGDGLERV
ncbi:MAG: DUF2306 domain-containing protein [Pseudomonadales bacterium]|nr:DUF2306 domain-containing protein [Pseudomonadales bacterium]